MTPEDMLANDLALNMPLDGMQLIEASAGTGKTFTIAGLYVRMVVERKLSVRQVLVMTFTRAATEELRQRLRKRLQLCAELADAAQADPAQPAQDASDVDRCWVLALLRRVRGQGGETAEALSRRLRMAVLEMDQAAIYTIDAFCQKVLTTWAMLLDDTVAGAQIEPSDRDLLEDFAADAWLRAAGEDDPLALQTLQSLAKDPATLAKLLSGLVSFAGAVEPMPAEKTAPAESLPDLEATRRRLFVTWREHGAAAVDLFVSRYRAGQINKNKFRQGSIEALHELAARLDRGLEPDAKQLARFALDKVQGAVNKGGEAFPDMPAFAAIQAWRDDLQTVEQILREQLPRTLQTVVAEARTWLAARKRELLRLSYNDLVEHLARGLTRGTRRTRLLKALREQYPCALIDEFQDTSPRQFSIFDTLYRDSGSLFLIGDPKQSIYAFRGGDVHAYLRAAERAREAGNAPHHLTHNYRSSPDMLVAIEAVFTATPDPFAQEGIAFEKVQWGGHVANDALAIKTASVPALTLWNVPDDLNADAKRDFLAEACAVQVATLLADGTLGAERKPVRPGNVAVLVNTNNEAMLMQDILRRHGVAAVCLRRESIYRSREAGELLRILDALLAPSSLRLARGALVTELMGRRLSDLARMDEDPQAWRTALDELSQLHERWFARGLLAMLEHLAERHAPRLLALADGERRLGNLLQLGESLQSDARHLAGERALRDLLARRIRDADENNEEEQLRLESDAERVPIVTLHRSKGLEYDVVMLPFAAMTEVKAPSAGHLALYHHDDGTAARRLLLYKSDERKPRDAPPDAQAEAGICDRAKAEILAEKVRCLYVGMTRARHACWMSTGKNAVLAHVFGDDGSGTTLARGHEGLIASMIPAPDEAAPRPAPAPDRDILVRRFGRTLRRDWWVHSFSQLADGEHDSVGALPGAGDEPAADGEEVPVEDDAQVTGWPRGARYGNAVHAVLEKTDMATWLDADGCPPGERSLLERELRGAGYAGEEQARALAGTVRLVAAAVSTPIVGDLRLADLKDADRRAEMAFHFGIDGAAPADIVALLHEHGYQRQRRDFARVRGQLRGMMTGIIDLVFRHQGQWWIVDYKTNYLGPRREDYAPARLTAAVAASDYDLQYLIYTVALHRWLRQSLGEAYDYARDIGGVRYLFLRGMDPADPSGHGIHADRPAAALIEALDDLLRAPVREVP